MLDQITPLVISYNEAANLRRTLDCLRWARRVVLLDSYSNDETLDIAREYPNVEIVQRKFDDFAGQCNWGLTQVRTEWTLSLDADYLLTPQLVEELRMLVPPAQVNGYFVRFRYCVFGKPLRGTLLPPREVLLRTACGHYLQDGHAHRLSNQGESRMLAARIWHDDRKPLSRWLAAQDRYMVHEVDKLRRTPAHQLSLPDRIRRLALPAPFLVLAYVLVIKGCLLDGWRGWHYAFQRGLAEMLLAIRLIEAARDTDRHTGESS